VATAAGTAAAGGAVFAAHPLWQRKLRKRTLKQGALLFNQKPRSGWLALQTAGLLPTPLTAEAAVQFLRTAPGLDKVCCLRVWSRCAVLGFGQGALS
jgi:hypothetical protein